MVLTGPSKQLRGQPPFPWAVQAVPQCLTVSLSVSAAKGSPRSAGCSSSDRDHIFATTGAVGAYSGCSGWEVRRGTEAQSHGGGRIEEAGDT